MKWALLIQKPFMVEKVTAVTWIYWCGQTVYCHFYSECYHLLRNAGINGEMLVP